MNSIKKSAITLLDGGMGRELKKIGAPFQQPEWSALALMQAPEYVTQVHKSFIDAGSDVITTNNYAVVPFHIGRERFNQQGAALTTLAGELAHQVASNSADTAVAGSIPPLYGSYRPDLFSPETAAEDYDIILPALAPYIDYWIAETISSLAEFDAIVAALKRLDTTATAKPLWISFSLQDQWQDGKAVLRSGESIAAALASAVNNKAAAILFNCSQPEYISAAVSEVSEIQQASAEKILIGAYANTFTPREATAKADEDMAEERGEMTPAKYLQFVESWIESGATLIGGCCGIGPEYINTIHQWRSA